MFIFWFFIIKLLTIIINVKSSPHEYRLLQDLKQDYDTSERPILNDTEAVEVNLRVLLQQIVDVDEKNQILNLVVWTQFTWSDYKLIWDPDEYGGIKTIQLPPDSVWRPDILLFNSADDKFDANFPVNVVVQHTGNVLYAPPAIIKTSCNIDSRWFPWDSQLCYLKYGSWTYTRDQLDLGVDSSGLESPHQMDLSYYVKHGEWDIKSTPARRVATEFANKKYVELYFYIHIKRKSLYYVINWIIPSSIISITNVLGFTLPSECGEKITLQITNLLSVLVFLGMVSDVTPVTSETIPIIALFFSASMLILGASIVSTILIINIFFRNPKTHKMTPWMKKIFLEYLPWLLLMNRPEKVFKRPEKLVFCKNKYEKYDTVIPTKYNSLSTPRLKENVSVTGKLIRVGSMASLERITTLHAESEAWKSVGGPPLRHNQELISKVERKKQNLLVKKMSERTYQSKNGISEDSDDLSSFRNERLYGSTRVSENENKHELYSNSEDFSCKRVCINENKKFDALITELHEFLKTAKQRIADEEDEENQNADWKFMALVVDRLSLYIFCILILAAIIVIPCSLPSEEPNYDFIE
uniref:Neuronal acetylcholine receptor subunit eat-2 (inferred by orthology to a C. elegans protein) n=1 Tax=Strongyloides venezuelensis TaxID=75913 RepID=A0A0K0F618_STRVS